MHGHHRERARRTSRSVTTAVSTSSYFAKTGNSRHAAVRIDLLDLAAGHPAQDVEVVDREVAEQPARLRRCRPRAAGPGRGPPGGPRTACRAHRSRPAGGPRGTPGRSGAGTRAGRRIPDRSMSAARAIVSSRSAGQRLLAERRHAAGRSRRGSARRGRDVAAAMTTASAVAIVSAIDVVAAVIAPISVRDLGGAGRDRRRRPGARRCRGCRAEEAGVEPADAPGAEERDPHRVAPSGEPGARGEPVGPAVPSRRSADASTRRPIAALSDGGAQVVSCSTISQPA